MSSAEGGSPNGSGGLPHRPLGASTPHEVRLTPRNSRKGRVGRRRAAGHPGMEMNGREEAAMTRTRRIARWMERMLLGAVMVVAARVIERHLLRAVGRR